MTVRASQIKKVDSMLKTAYDLADCLHSYRQKRMREKFGEAMLNDLGPRAILPDGVIQRLVECTEAKKILLVDDIKKETKWKEVHEYGQDVLEIILR